MSNKDFKKVAIVHFAWKVKNFENEISEYLYDQKPCIVSKRYESFLPSDLKWELRLNTTTHEDSYGAKEDFVEIELRLIEGENKPTEEMQFKFQLYTFDNDGDVAYIDYESVENGVGKTSPFTLDDLISWVDENGTLMLMCEIKQLIKVEAKD